MAAGSERTHRRSRRSSDRRYYASIALLMAIALVTAWQAISYAGIMAILAEWQFDAFGRYRPLLTYLVLITLICLPVYLLTLAQQRSRRRSRRRKATSKYRSAQNAMRLAKFLVVGAAMLAIAAIAAYAFIWTLPSSEGVAARVQVAANGVPPSGPAILEGEVIYDRISALDQRVWFLARTIRFVPVVAPNKGGRGSILRFFVVLPQTDDATSGSVPREWTGTLRAGGLPGEVIPLYRYAGYRIASPYYVLFTAPDMLTWANRMLAMQFTIAALIMLIGGLLQLAHARRMERALRSTPQPSAPAPPDSAFA